MLRYLIFILVFNAISFAQDFDIYEISDPKPVAKRQLPPEPRQEPTKPTPVNNPPAPPQNAVQHKPQNTDSVKKDLNRTENSNSAAVSATNSQTDAVKNESHNKTEVKPKDSEVKEDKVAPKNNSTEPNFKNPKHADVHPGAALRGFYVFLGLSILIIIYFVFKAFRLRPGAPPPTTVRKYGIVGRRSDMEMLPLPLAEEEDDDTLFDMGTQVNR